MYQILDLQFKNIKEAIAAFLIESSQGPILIETGPFSTFENLKKELKKWNYKPEDIQHVFLTHIHFDHAGAAWKFAEHGAQIYVHPFGKLHLHNPAKLVASATKIYGDEMDSLWGEMKTIDVEKLITPQHEEAVKIGEWDIVPLYTPGHAQHHIAWQIGDCIFAGDVAGVMIGNGPVVPPCPPPDINIEEWNASLDLLQNRKAKELVLTHYGKVTDIDRHILFLRKILNEWAYWIKEKWESGMSAQEITPQFMEYTQNLYLKNHLSKEACQKYEAANPAWMSVNGLIRYWHKKNA